MDLDKQEFDFYFSLKQLKELESFYMSITFCFFKGRLYSECCEKGTKSKFDDAVFIGSGFFKDISTRLIKE